MPDRPFAWEKSYPPGVSWDITITPTTIPAKFDAAVAEFGPKPAIDFRDGKISYAKLGREVGRAGATLISHGVGSGTAVALYLPNVPWHPIAFFASLKAGGRVVHLSPLDAERDRKSVV